MVLGMWFGAWGSRATTGPWNGLLHRHHRWRRWAASCTPSPRSTFGVDHIISGVAINLIASPGAMARYPVARRSSPNYDGGSDHASHPGSTSSSAKFTFPFLAGGRICSAGDRPTGCGWFDGQGLVVLPLRLHRCIQQGADVQRSVLLHDHRATH